MIHRYFSVLFVAFFLSTLLLKGQSSAPTVIHNTLSRQELQERGDSLFGFSLQSLMKYYTFYPADEYWCYADSMCNQHKEEPIAPYFRQNFTALDVKRDEYLQWVLDNRDNEGYTFVYHNVAMCIMCPTKWLPKSSARAEYYRPIGYYDGFYYSCTPNGVVCYKFETENEVTLVEGFRFRGGAEHSNDGIAFPLFDQRGGCPSELVFVSKGKVKVFIIKE